MTERSLRDLLRETIEATRAADTAAVRFTVTTGRGSTGQRHERWNGVCDFRVSGAWLRQTRDGAETGTQFLAIDSADYLSFSGEPPDRQWGKLKADATPLNPLAHVARLATSTHVKLHSAPTGGSRFDMLVRPRGGAPPWRRFSPRPRTMHVALDSAGRVNRIRLTSRLSRRTGFYELEFTEFGVEVPQLTPPRVTGWASLIGAAMDERDPA